MFAILGDRVPGSRFLDLFAGTGANGLEALSRGAATAHFVEVSKAASQIIRDNIRSLEFEACATLTTGVLPSVLSRISGRMLPFDIIFADPPYESDLLEHLLRDERLPRLLAPGGCLVVEAGRRGELPQGVWYVDSTRDYGDTRLFFLATPPSV